MLQNYNKWKILAVFFDDPVSEEGGFRLRELSRLAKIAPTSVKIYINELKREGLIKELKSKHTGYPLYYADRDNKNFLLYKKINTIIMLEESGLIDTISEECLPEAIMLFGSASRGEDIKTSDIDLFVYSKEKKIKLDNFERKIGRKLNIFFSDNFKKLSDELKNNIANGIKLRGYLKLY